jgi:hypothetical protein
MSLCIALQQNLKQFQTFQVNLLGKVKQVRVLHVAVPQEIDLLSLNLSVLNLVKCLAEVEWMLSRNELTKDCT